MNRLTVVNLLLATLPPLTALATLSPAPAHAAIVLAAGDIADCRTTPAADSAAERTAQLIAAQLKQHPDAKILTLGDNTYPVGAPDEFKNCYAPTWGRFLQATHPAPGNHDYLTPGAQGYFDYFGDRAGKGQRGYYRVQIGAWRVFSLNSYLKNPLEHAAQLAWLKQELASSHATCTLAYWHHPVFSSGGHGNDKRMDEAWELLEAFHADLILSGHDHDYERFARQNGKGEAVPDGMREFVVGTGGTPLTPLLLRRNNSEAVNNTDHGVLKLNLKDDGYDWEFLAVPGASFSDRGSDTCHGKRASAQAAAKVAP
jgi:3',5'-cyclic AMP phosphodiesterase CpdA